LWYFFWQVEMEHGLINGNGIGFSYQFGESPVAVLDGIDIEINKGEWIAILGRNGSGKSTLVKHFNALVPLQHGALTVAGIDAKDEREKWRLRRLCGMVFQNPDNQFVSSVLEEDIAFGLENYETPRDAIPAAVEAALRFVGLDGYGKRSPHTLSGGQKQRAALAGVLALNPDIVIFDEATSMLDPEGRAEILAAIKQLRDETGKTIVMITHYPEEAINADKIFLMHRGKLLAAGTPRAILTDMELLNKAELLPPIPARLYHDLTRRGIALQHCPLTNEEFVEELCRW
jgi:energy-coupling factor transport system ATP-binding protein